MATVRNLAVALVVTALAGVLAPAPALAQDEAARSGASDVAVAETGDSGWRHALSLIGEPKYGPDFKHFASVNPQAPKGGRIRLGTVGTFDSLNPFPPKGNTGVAFSSLIYDSLMTNSLEVSSTEYGLIAEAVRYPSDYSSATFRLREGARFHDGHPIEPEDVIWSFTELKRVSPQFAFYYQNVVAAEQTGPREVTFKFDVTDNRELPQIVGQLVYVLPKHWWTAADADGNPRNLGEATLERPVGSGPYRIGKVDPGKTLTLERVTDYWAADLPVRAGQFNFDTIQYEFYRDDTVAFEAFKVGDFDFEQINSSKRWSTEFDFPDFENGEVKREALEIDRVLPMQGFAFNLRRKKFQDPRVRRAFNYAFDFEWTNQNVFYGLYQRTDSFFGGSELQATGLPEGQELDILKAVQAEAPDGIPGEVFTTPYFNPETNGPRAFRNNLREAAKLLRDAGYRQKNGVMTHREHDTKLEVEFLIVSPTFERVILPYVQNLKRIGINATVRRADVSQYQRNVRAFEFDIIIDNIAQSRSPGNEQREFWGSAAADKPGSRNRAGIKNPAVDKLIDRIIFAKDRAELVAATNALDRVLLWNHYFVPQWNNPQAWVAYRSWMTYPENRPKLSPFVLQVWWDSRLETGASQ